MKEKEKEKDKKAKGGLGAELNLGNIKDIDGAKIQAENGEKNAVKVDDVDAAEG